MPQDYGSLFNIYDTPAPSEAPAVQEQAPKVNTNATLNKIQEGLDTLGVEKKPAQPKSLEVPEIKLDPSKMQNTDPGVIEDLENTFVPAIQNALKSVQIPDTSTSAERLDHIARQMEALTGTVSEMASRDLQRQTRQEAEAKREKIKNAVPGLTDLLHDEKFKEYMKEPLQEGASLKVGQLLKAAEMNGDVDTIRAYVATFKARQEESKPGTPPASIPTSPQGAGVGEEPVNSQDIQQLRRHLKRTGDRRAIAEKLRDIKLEI